MEWKTRKNQNLSKVKMAEREGKLQNFSKIGKMQVKMAEWEEKLQNYSKTGKTQVKVAKNKWKWQNSK